MSTTGIRIQESSIFTGAILAALVCSHAGAQTVVPPVAPAQVVAPGRVEVPVYPPERVIVREQIAVPATVVVPQLPTAVVREEVVVPQTTTVVTKPTTVIAQPATAVVRGPDSLRLAGILLEGRNTGRMVVERVAPGSAAALAGVRPGDVITRIYRSRVPSFKGPKQYLPEDAISRLELERNGQSRQVNLVAYMPTVRPILRPEFDATERAEREYIGGTGTGAESVERIAVRPPAPIDGRATRAGVSGGGGAPQGPGTPGLGSAAPEGGGSAAMRTGHAAPLLPGQPVPLTPSYHPGIR